MKKTISLILAFALAALPAMAFHNSYGSYGNYNYYERNYYDGNNRYDRGYAPTRGYDYYDYTYRANYEPRYREYYERNDFKRDRKLRDFRQRAYYQEATSPYVVVNYPYGERPWRKPYGETFRDRRRENLAIELSATNKGSVNPFHGFAYYRAYHCHTPAACHYHSIFPDSPNH